MLSKEDNELLTRIGPGTPCGELLRRYWHPVCAVAELSEDRPKKRITILGEDLVVFRSADGTYGLVAEQCSHRGASLYYGFLEDGCIRCPYHGWLYDTHGRCVEQPFEPQQSLLKHTIRHPAYPVETLGGLLFTYMGPPETRPLLPRWEMLTRDDGNRKVEIRPVLDCNWLQPMENTVDITHTYFLHDYYEYFRAKSLGQDPGEAEAKRPLVEYGFKPFEWGILKSWNYGGSRPALFFGRPLVFPNMLRLGNAIHWRVPIDDTHTRIFVLSFRATADGSRAENPDDVPCTYAPSWLNEEGEYTMVDNQSQDGMAWESQGRIFDRSTKEHLGASDRGITMLRELLKEQIEIVQRGDDPIGTVRSADRAEIDVRYWMSEGGGPEVPQERIFDAQLELFQVPLGAAREE